jgi:hypothetical protein
MDTKLIILILVIVVYFGAFHLWSSVADGIYIGRQPGSHRRELRVRRRSGLLRILRPKWIASLESSTDSGTGGAGGPSSTDSGTGTRPGIRDWLQYGIRDWRIFGDFLLFFFRARRTTNSACLAFLMLRQSSVAAA